MDKKLSVTGAFFAGRRGQGKGFAKRTLPCLGTAENGSAVPSPAPKL